MTVEFHEQHGGKIAIVRVTERLSREDYDAFVPEVERMIGRFGAVRMLVEMHDFHGWDAGALWEDIKFGAKHFANIDRLALVGDKKWQKGMSAFCKPFTTAQVRYFDDAEIQQAHEWIAAGIETPP